MSEFSIWLYAVCLGRSVREWSLAFPSLDMRITFELTAAAVCHFRHTIFTHRMINMSHVKIHFTRRSYEHLQVVVWLLFAVRSITKQCIACIVRVHTDPFPWKEFNRWVNLCLFSIESMGWFTLDLLQKWDLLHFVANIWWSNRIYSTQKCLTFLSLKLSLK